MNDDDELRQRLEASLPVLRRYARKLYRQRAADAADLVQATVLRSLAKSHLWQPGTNLDGWLMHIMHNQFINQLRQDARRGEMYKESLDETRQSGVDNPAIGLVVRDLKRALAKMDARYAGQRSQILLRIARGDSYAQVARDLAMPIGTVRSSLSRARQELKIMMDRSPR